MKPTLLRWLEAHPAVQRVRTLNPDSYDCHWIDISFQPGVSFERKQEIQAEAGCIIWACPEARNHFWVPY